MRELLFLLPVAYGLADSFAGGSLGAKAKALDDKLPGRAAFWGALLCAGLGYLSAGVPGALMGLVWLIWRTPTWDVFGGDATPVGVKEIAGTFARHLIAMLGVVTAYWAHNDVVMSAMAFVAFAAGATFLACWYTGRNMDAAEAGEPIDPKDNRFLELCRGVLFGLAAVASLI